MSELTPPGSTAPELEEIQAQPGALRIPPREITQLEDVPMELAMELARVKITIRELLELAPGSTLKLPNAACDGLSVMLGGQCIARGEISSHDNCYGVRVLEVIDNADARGDQS